MSALEPRAASAPRDEPLVERLLVIDPTRRRLGDHRVGDLPDLLRAGDLLVVNDAATLPASLAGLADGGAPVELRLAALRPDGAFTAVLFGAGDYRTPTEHRPAPPRLAPGARIALAGLTALVDSVDAASPRLLTVRFDRAGDALWPALYRAGHPVQYAHVPAPLPLWSVQTAWAGPPVAAEMPSAGRPLGHASLLALRRHGVALAALTHAAGLSSTGDAALDARLPLPERYTIPAATVAAVAEAHARGGRVVAVGTTVVRALEGCAATHGHLIPGDGETALRVASTHARTIVDGLLTGLHGPGTSHFALLEAFAPRALLLRAWRHAARAGYLQHEFGDSCLILPSLIEAKSAV